MPYYRIVPAVESTALQNGHGRDDALGEPTERNRRNFKDGSIWRRGKQFDDHQSA